MFWWTSFSAPSTAFYVKSFSLRFSVEQNFKNAKIWIGAVRFEKITEFSIKIFRLPSMTSRKICNWIYLTKTPQYFGRQIFSLSFYFFKAYIVWQVVALLYFLKMSLALMSLFPSLFSASYAPFVIVLSCSASLSKIRWCMRRGRSFSVYLEKIWNFISNTENAKIFQNCAVIFKKCSCRVIKKFLICFLFFTMCSDENRLSDSYCSALWK